MAITVSIETRKLSKQLRCPVGEEGSELGQTMYESNKNMISDTVRALRVGKKSRVLEIGPGNGEHVDEILKERFLVRYFGLDISQTMIRDAQNINTEFIEQRKATFELYDGRNIPFVHNFFDRILTINTIYFWEFPELFLDELYRVLKPGGTLVITFVDAKTMQGLSFADGSFELYDIPRMTKLISSSPFTDFDIRTKTEHVESKDGNMVDREYLVVRLEKKLKVLEKDEGKRQKQSLKKLKCHGH